MTRILVGGYKRADLKRLIDKMSIEGIEVEESSDMDAAQALIEKMADYYIGVCATGSSSLALVRALLGNDKCILLSIVTKTLKPEEIKKAVNDGYVCFGIMDTNVEKVTPVLINYIKEKERLN